MRELIWKGDPNGIVQYVECPSCRHLYHTQIYAAKEELRLAQARKNAAQCSICAEKRKSPLEAEIDADAYVARRIERARKVTDLEECFSDSGDAYYRSVEEAAEAGETGVFGSEFKPYRVDFGSLLESVIEDHHEDASIDDLVGVDELGIAVDAFNSKQRMGSYEMDDKVWQKIEHKRTFAMIKPDATQRGVEEDMIADMVSAGFTVIQREKRTLTRSEAEWLYGEHKNKEHFGGLVDYTISGEVVLLLLEGSGDNVPLDFRALMGPTDRTKAEPNTLRAKYAIGYRENSIHGSDSPGAATDEIIYFMSRSSGK